MRKWRRFEQDVKRTRKQLDLPQASLAFQFVEVLIVNSYISHYENKYTLLYMQL